MNKWILPLLLLIEIGFFTMLSGTSFQSVGEFGNYFKSYFGDLLAQSAPVLLLAFGMTLVLMTAGIDLSVGSQGAGLIEHRRVPLPHVGGYTLSLFHSPREASGLVRVLR